MRHPIRAGLLAMVVAGAALISAPAAHASSTDPAPPVLYVLVPNVVGETPGEAQHILAKNGLNLGLLSTVPDCENIGRVIRQNPLAAAKVQRGSAVNVVVGVQPRTPCP